MKKKKILISGWYGFGNVGDEAILQALIDDFEKKFEGAQFCALSYKPNYTKKTQGIDAAHQLPFTLISWISWFIKLRFIKTLWAFLWCDVFVMGGGGFLSDWDPKVPSGWLKQFKVAKFLRKETMLYGIGAGPFKSQHARISVRHYVNNYVDSVTVRDNQSYQCLVGDCEVNASIVDVKIDPVANMNVERYIRPEVKRGYIGVVYTKYFDRPIYGKEQNRWPDLLNCFINQIETVKSHGFAVKLIFFQPDMEKELSETLLAATGVSVAYPQNYKEAIAEMSSCYGIISFRLHGNILSHAMNLPYLPIVYHHKGLGFLDMVGFDRPFNPIIVGDGENIPMTVLDIKKWQDETKSFLDYVRKNG